MITKKQHLLQQVSDVDFLVEVFEGLYLKNRFRTCIDHEKYPFAQAKFVHLNRKKIAQLLSLDLRAGQYEFQKAEARVVIADKKRNLYYFNVFDKWLHTAFAKILTASIFPKLSSNVYSYRQGYSQTSAISSLKTYLRQHKKKYSNKSLQGLFTFRRDIKSYTDSMNTSPDSPLWPIMKELLFGLEPLNSENEIFFKYIQTCLHPELKHPIEKQGAPTGSPISTIAANIYLLPLDLELEMIEGSFYARFGDDALFCTPSYQDFIFAVNKYDLVISQLGLTARADKSLDFFFNGAGRPKNKVRGQQTLTYLGVDFNYRGTRQVKSEKKKKFFALLRKRLQLTKNILDGFPIASLAEVLCKVTNNVLWEKHKKRDDYFIKQVMHNTDERNFLKQLDYQIAITLANCITSNFGVKSFRFISPKKLRNWGLISLVNFKNSRAKYE